MECMFFNSDQPPEFVPSLQNAYQEQQFAIEMCAGFVKCLPTNRFFV